MADRAQNQFEGSHIIRIGDLVREVYVLWIEDDPERIGWWVVDGADASNGAYDTSQFALAAYLMNAV